jgi:hypothetical protein
MAEHSSTEMSFQKLKDLRRSLLRLHKTLLDQERAAYEQVHGAVSTGQMLQLVIGHEQFAWLHTLSEFIVRIDELLDPKEPSTEAEATALLDQARALLTPAEDGSEFQRKYFRALQHQPDAAVAHGETISLFED